MPHVKAHPKPHPQAPATLEPFTCAVHGQGRGVAWVSARGELDLASTPKFQRSLAGVLERALVIIVDLRQLTFVDSTGLHAIIDADARARRTGHRLVFIRGSERIHRLFTLVGLTDQLKIVDLTPGRAGADGGDLADFPWVAC